MSSKLKVNPFINIFMRLIGEWPLTGSPPLSEKQYKQLFSDAPSFADYFPVVDFDYENEVYLMDDGLNVALMFEVETKYMASKSKGSLERFNEAITRSLNSLPSNQDEPIPYVCQIFLVSQEVDNIGDYMESKIPKEIAETAYTQEVLRITKEHSDFMTNKAGVFDDTRVQGKGWRVADQRVYMCIYQKMAEKDWNKQDKTPTQKIKDDLVSFLQSMKTAGLTVGTLQPHQLINWLAPFFGSSLKVNEKDVHRMRGAANFDLGQVLIDNPPTAHQFKDNKDRGIWQFGDTWSRYLTTTGIAGVPESRGMVTLGSQSEAEKDDKDNITASFFEHLPQGTMIAYTIVPQNDANMRFEIEEMLRLSEDGSSNEAKYATEQAMAVQNEMLRNGQHIYYFQMGLFLTADSLQELKDKTEASKAVIELNQTLNLVDAANDLIAQDSYIRALPCIYDWSHDRNNALRARKAYTSHIASVLPFYGNKGGGKTPCYVAYSRTGEPFFMNPLSSDDRVEVAHELVFGPSGSGKSAQVVYMTMMSMAVNNSRMFIFDYGNSFKLFGDFAESLGKKVKRVTLDLSSDDVLAPFVETKKALVEAEIAEKINKGESIVDKKIDKETEANANEEKRSYLGEMEYVLKIMITQGRESELEKLSPASLSYINKALVRGLKISQEDGEPHARPAHMYAAMLELSNEEAGKADGLEEIALDLRKMAEAINLWTQGQRGILFNRTGTGFSADYDLTIIEQGNLGKQGAEDMRAVAGLAGIYNIIALAESLDGSGRDIEVKVDEAHLWASIGLLMGGLSVGQRVFRKLGCWLSIITQNISDLGADYSKTIVENAEFKWLLKMSRKEIKQAVSALDLTEETQHMITQPTKEKHNFVEGVSICKKYSDSLIRFVPPAIAFALAQTDNEEKTIRKKIMEEQGCTELEAALIIAQQIHQRRKDYQTKKRGRDHEADNK